MEEDTTKPLSKVIRIDEREIRGHLDKEISVANFRKEISARKFQDTHQPLLLMLRVQPVSSEINVVVGT